MAEEKIEPRAVNLRQLLPWTELFRAFSVALEPKKLLFAAAGILAMAFWWWLWAVIFFSSPLGNKPIWPKDYNAANFSGDTEEERNLHAWYRFKEDRHKWDLLYQAAGTEAVAGRGELEDAGDLAFSPEEFDQIKKEIDQGNRAFAIGGKKYALHAKHYGRMRTWPWFEDRGPNPYLLVTGNAGGVDDDGNRHYVPWQRGEFADWFATKEVPVLVEPLVKFLRPVIFLLHSNAGFWNYIYFTIVLVGTLAIWALFGGAITRMAAVQIARKEKIGIGEALRFTMSRWLSFFCAPLIPLLFILGIALLLMLFGLFHLIPLFGDIVVDGLLWGPLVLTAGLVMAGLLVGLVGWPMMYATISVEGSDGFDALSRSYSYVYQSPWQYLWYCLVSLAYGAVVVFFVGLMGSLTVYLGKWGVSQTPFTSAADRDPSYLFIYAPTSFGWQDLLLQGSNALDSTGQVKAGYLDNLKWYNKAGAFLVSVWLYLAFLVVLGFGYSFFWSVSTIIYLLMRQKVDETELDEIYLEEDEGDEAYSPSPAAAPVAHPPATGPALTMVEPPSLKTPAAPMAVPVPPRVEANRSEGGDGNPPPASPDL